MEKGTSQTGGVLAEAAGLEGLADEGARRLGAGAQLMRPTRATSLWILSSFRSGMRHPAVYSLFRTVPRTC